MSITVFKRYEKKFLMDEAMMERLMPVLLEHMELDKFCKNGQSYHICNLYYDTAQNDVIRDSLQHPYYKEKLRMRSYGIPKDGSTKVFLELKKKVAGEVTKRRAKLRYDEAQRFLADRTMPEGLDYLDRQILREVEYYLSHKDVKPTVFVSYDRVALFDRSDKSFRLTFDYNLRTLRGDVSFEKGVEARPLMEEGFRLMEVKVSNAYPKWFADLLSDNGIHRHSFSKFGVEYKTHLKNTVLRQEALDVLSHL